MAANDYALLRSAACLLGLALLASCTSVQETASVSKQALKPSPITGSKKQVYSYSAADRECLKRAMYFESKRSSRDGLMAVGSVVMNRLTSGEYADSICGVVGQKRQFAPGVMTRKMSDKAAPELNEAADAILRGERNRQVKEAMFFHTEGLRFRYDNMHYVTVAGGNAFYEKRGDNGALQTAPPKSPDEYMMAFAPHMATQPGLMVINDMGAASAAMVQTASATMPGAAQAPDLASGDIVAAPVPLQRPREITFPPVPQPVTVASNGAAAAQQAPAAQQAQAYAAPQPQVYTQPPQQQQAYAVAQAENFAVPAAVPVPSRKPQVASIMQVSQPMNVQPQARAAAPGNAPQVWSMRPNKP